MSKSNTPVTDKGRVTRSGTSAQTSTCSLNDIKCLIDDRMKDLATLIEHTKAEILQTFRKEIDELNQKMSVVQVNVDDLKKTNEMLKKKSHLIEEEIVAMKQQQINVVTEITHEVEERERRKLNVIVSGLPELSALEDEDDEDDEGRCTEMLRTLNISNADSVTVHRIGKTGQNNRPRLLKIKCTDIEQKISILRKARELRPHQKYKDVFINPDRTVMQREIHKELLREVVHRRGQGEDVVIFRDKVVTRRNERNRHF